MDLLEIGAIAQLLGAIAILVSLIFLVVELRKNLKQNNIANSLLRAIELEKLNYKQMTKFLSHLLRDGANFNKQEICNQQFNSFQKYFEEVNDISLYLYNPLQ